MAGNRKRERKESRLYEGPLNGNYRKRVKKAGQEIGKRNKKKDRMYERPLNGIHRKKVRKTW